MQVIFLGKFDNVYECKEVVARTIRSCLLHTRTHTCTHADMHLCSELFWEHSCSFDAGVLGVQLAGPKGR